jgi:threonyl-tRNA synthetase
MRERQIKKIPYTMMIGHKEVNDDLISYRKYGSEETITVSKETFLTLLKLEINQKK